MCFVAMLFGTEARSDLLIKLTVYGVYFRISEGYSGGSVIVVSKL